MKTLKILAAICGVFLLSEVKAEVYGGGISVPSSQLIVNGYYCPSNYPLKIKNQQSAWNGTPPYTYEWQYAFYSNGPWNPISNSNADSLILPVPAPGTYLFYRRKVTDAVNSIAYSNSVEINKCVFYYGGEIRFKPSTSNNDLCYEIWVPVGYQPPAITGISSASINAAPSQYTYYDWWESPTNTAYVYVSGWPDDGLSYTPPPGNAVGIKNYKRGSFCQECSCLDVYQSYSNYVTVHFEASNPVDPGIIVSNVQTAAIGNTIHFNNSPPLNCPYCYYQWQQSIDGITWTDIPGATNFTYQETLTAHKYFRRRVWTPGCRIAFTNSKFLRTMSSISNYNNSNCNSFTLQSVKGNSAWFDVAGIDTNIIASINPNGLDLGTVTINMKHFGEGVTNIPQSNLIPFMPRHLEISSSSYGNNNFPSPVGVRIYYKNSEFNDFKTKLNDPLLTTSDLRISHYHGANQDCDVNNNTPGGTVEITPTKGTFADGFYLQFNVNSFSEFDAVSKNLPLPVSWLSFTGEYNNSQVLLKWSVANQVNNKGFTIQRSINGINYEDVGWVNASNVASQVEYSFVDRSPSGKILYYRLRQVDTDNRAKYSNTITIRTNNKSKFVVQPNPVTNNWFVVQAPTTETIHYKIINTSGQVVLNGTTSNNAKVGVEQLSKGVYTLQLSTSNDVQVMKLLKL